MANFLVETSNLSFAVRPCTTQSKFLFRLEFHPRLQTLHTQLMENKTEFDFVSIGDTVIDAFIKLSTGHLQETAHGEEYCIPYGAKIPFDEAYV